MRLPLNADTLLHYLTSSAEQDQAELFRAADETRSRIHGGEVHFRGLIEFSNYCRRECHYCGLRALRRVDRYQMSGEEIMACARQAMEFGYGSVVLQSGEWPFDPNWLADIIREIKSTTPLAVTLSVGEHPTASYRLWREAGADRFLLRVETTNPALYAAIHPGAPFGTRQTILHDLRDLGYEIGSGVMVGIPGQTFRDLAADLLWFQSMDLDMIGVGPYIAHPDTPLGAGAQAAPPDQVPATVEMTGRVVALARVLCPQANIPATTAVATLDKAQGREAMLTCGANVIMPNLTPLAYRAAYEIYPAKACIDETAQQCRSCLAGRLAALGRVPGKGKGGRKRERYAL